MATLAPSRTRRYRWPGAAPPVLLLGLSILLGSAELQAQEEPEHRAAPPAVVEPAVLEGTVRSSSAAVAGSVGEATGAPLPGAEVWILGTGVGTLSDDEGRFRLAGLPPGRYRLLVGARGHREAVVTVEVGAGETGRVGVGLETLDADLQRRAAVLLDQAESKARGAGVRGFRERMESGFGEYVTGIEIDAAGTPRLSEVIRNYTSADVQRCSDRGGGTEADCFWVVTGTRLRISGVVGAIPSAPAAEGGSEMASLLRSQGSPQGPAGKPCVADVYLDGVPMDQEVHPSGIDVVPSTQVEGIEIYKRGALAPARYRSVGGCGVVLLWSRSPGASSSG